MLVDSVGYLKKSDSSVNADIKKAQIKPYRNIYLNDFNTQSFLKNIDTNVAKNNSNTLVGRFLNLFA